MDDIKLIKIIATRRFKLENGREVILNIGMPMHFTDSTDYYCPFQLKGLDDSVRFAGGVDSYQALTCALGMVEALLAKLSNDMGLKWIIEDE